MSGLGCDFNVLSWIPLSSIGLCSEDEVNKEKINRKQNKKMNIKTEFGDKWTLTAQSLYSSQTASKALKYV